MSQFKKINTEAQDAFSKGQVVYKSSNNYGCAVFPNLIWKNNLESAIK
ncbi:hypothetical protein [Bacillus cereus]|nr:hypothetical protein [Bacillus cereus]